MKRSTQVFLAVVAVVLVSAEPAEKFVQPAPDDPADVKTVQGCLPRRCVKLDRDGDVVMVSLDGKHLQECPSLGPALRRLRHVGWLGAGKDGDLILETVKSWPVLEEAYLGDVTEAGIGILEGMKYLSTLQIQQGNVTDAIVKRIGKLKNLLKLSIPEAAITDACMKDIAGLPRLKHLNLNKTAITDRGLAELKAMELESLELRSTKITDRGIDAIKNMTTIKLLDVLDTKVTSAALAKLKGIPGLELWAEPPDARHEVRDDPNDVAAIQAASGHISARKDNVTDNVYFINACVDRQKPGGWMKHFKGLHNLKVLWLPNRFTEDDDLALLTGLQTLEYLKVGGHGVSDAGMKYIGGLTSLRNLELGCPRITAAGIKQLARLKNLQALNLNMTPINDDGLRHLGKLVTLEGLTLGDSSKITDDGLAHLANLGNLKGLALGDAPITNAGLVHLRGLKKLRGLCAGKGVTRDGLIDLKKYVPRLIVPDEPVAPVP